MGTRLLLTLGVVLALFAQGCSTPPRKEAVPAALTSQAEIPGIPGARYRLTEIDVMARDGLESVERERRHLASIGHKGPLPPAVYLAVSGGGDAGAFGAGLLNGWTKAGNRPQFKLVTGISTGALIAPFAFLGPKYDDRLREFYTNIGPADIVEQRSFWAAITPTFPVARRYFTSGVGCSTRYSFTAATTRSMVSARWSARKSITGITLQSRLRSPVLVSM